VQVLPPAPAVFDQVKDDVRQQLQQDRSLGVWRDYMTKQIKDSHVVYADTYRPADPDAMPSATGNDPAAAQQAPLGAPAPDPAEQAPNAAPPR
jgi:peptidyl-prolyl cis-trans isomerase C